MNFKQLNCGEKSLVQTRVDAPEIKFHRRLRLEGNKVENFRKNRWLQCSIWHPFLQNWKLVICYLKCFKTRKWNRITKRERWQISISATIEINLCSYLIKTQFTFLYWGVKIDLNMSVQYLHICRQEIHKKVVIRVRLS